MFQNTDNKICLIKKSFINIKTEYFFKRLKLTKIKLISISEIQTNPNFNYDFCQGQQNKMS